MFFEAKSTLISTRRAKSFGPNLWPSPTNLNRSKKRSIFLQKKRKFKIHSHLFSLRRTSWLIVDSDVLWGFVEILQQWQPAGEKKSLWYYKACGGRKALERTEAFNNANNCLPFKKVHYKSSSTKKKKKLKWIGFDSCFYAPPHPAVRKKTTWPLSC